MPHDDDDEGFKTAPVRKIGDKDIKFLAAGQKIDDIETAIRELVENSVDAKSKNIEVRLTKFGVESIEVEDNGHGIESSNFHNLAVRYHTSKIKDYENFQDSLQTYGFRGEALSCLCSIANVTIITKSKIDKTGSKLTFKKDGTFTKVQVGRDTGTTVIVKNLFHSLPVRRRELESSCKRQYDKVVRLLYEQALARPHIKFSLCKKVGARKDKDFTHGGTSLEGCLITIFGLKLMDTLLPIRPPPPPPKTAALKKLDIDDGSANHVVDEEEEVSRDSMPSSQDSQNESQMEASQLVPASQPVKRSLAALESTAQGATNAGGQTQIAIANFAPSDVFSQAHSSKFYMRRSTSSRYAKPRVEFSIHGYISKIGCGRNSTDSQYLFVNKKPCDIPKVARLINEIYRNFNQNQQSPFYCLFISVQNFATDFNVPHKRNVILQECDKLCELVKECLEGLYATSVPASQTSCPVAQIPFAPQNNKPMTSGVNGQNHSASMGNSKSTQNQEPAQQKEPVGSPKPKSSDHSSPELVCGLRMDDVADSIPDLYEVASRGDAKRARKTTTTDSRHQNQNPPGNNGQLPGFQNSYDLYREEVTGVTKGATTTGGHRPPDASATSSPSGRLRQLSRSPEKRLVVRPPSTVPPTPPPCKFRQDELLLDDTIKVYLNGMEDLAAALETERIDRLPKQDTRQFSFAIHPNFNGPAEDQLKMNLNKTSFAEMQIFGQFNRGFILTKLNKHIFIIDQHAADERANFEDQLEHSPMVKQRMAHPQPIYLNLIQENAILNHMEIFNKHGFEFLVDTTKTVGYRVIQTATSICRESGRTEHFGKEDIEELIDVAIESPGRLETYTLKKVKNLAASIACRKSVMVGDKLTWQQMSQIIRKMSDLKNPWVCAHNRPTIRHLMDTDWRVFDT